MSEHALEPIDETDDPLELIDDRISAIERAAADLRRLGAETANPSIERNAKRMEGVAAALRRQAPPELVSDEE